MHDQTLGAAIRNLGPLIHPLGPALRPQSATVAIQRNPRPTLDFI